MPLDYCISGWEAKGGIEAPERAPETAPKQTQARVPSVFDGGRAQEGRVAAAPQIIAHQFLHQQGLLD